MNEGRTKEGRRNNGELAKDERRISDSAVKSFCSCSTRSVCCKKLIRRLVRISLRMQNKNNDAYYLHRQINVILMQIYKKSGRLLTYSSFFLLLLLNFLLFSLFLEENTLILQHSYYINKNTQLRYQILDCCFSDLIGTIYGKRSRYK